MIVPRRVLGRGFQAPSDTVNVAVVGINGMGAANAHEVMSQNIVAICDCDLGLLDGKLAEWSRAQRPSARPQAPAAPETFRTWPRSKAQLAADARWPADDPYRQAAEVRQGSDSPVEEIPGLPRDARQAEGHRRCRSSRRPITCTRSSRRPRWSRQARLRAEAALLVRARSATPGKEGGRRRKSSTQMGNQRHSLDDQRQGVEYILDGAIGEVREVHVWTNRPWGYWPQGIPRPAPRPRSIPRSSAWDNRGVDAATRGGDEGGLSRSRAD